MTAESVINHPPAEPDLPPSRISTVLTITALVGLGLYGHWTHWTFLPHLAPAERTAAKERRPAGQNPDQVEFESEDAVARAGIGIIQPLEQVLPEEVLATGVTAYDERFTAQLAPRVAGNVWRAEKHLGDFVRRGETLAIIDSSEVGRLKADFLSALVSVESRKELLERLEQVPGAVADRTIREARVAMRDAQIRLKNAEQALVNLGLPIHAAKYLQMSDDERQASILVAGLPASVTGSLDLAELSSNLLPVVAPFDGIVIGRALAIGEVVSPTNSVLEITDTHKMWLILNVSKQDANRVALGQRVRFRADGVDAELESRISWISTEVDKTTRTLTVRADVAADSLIANEPGQPTSLKANLFGTGRILVRQQGTALVVPKDCLHRDRDQTFVFVQTSPTTFVSRKVKRGLSFGDVVQIIGDITPDTRIAAQGSHMLKSEQVLARLESGSE